MQLRKQNTRTTNIVLFFLFLIYRSTNDYILSECLGYTEDMVNDEGYFEDEYFEEEAEPSVSVVLLVLSI